MTFDATVVSMPEFVNMVAKRPAAVYISKYWNGLRLIYNKHHNLTQEYSVEIGLQNTVLAVSNTY